MAGKTQQKYFQDWYDEKGGDWNEKRRRRYAEDLEYREKVQRWNQEARERRKVDGQGERRAARKAVKMRSSGAWKTTEIEVDGVRTRMFTIGALARVLGKGISTIRVWEKKGVLPETPHRSSKGDRLYTVEMVEATQAALRQAGKLERSREVLRKKKKPSSVVRTVKFKGERKPQEVQLFKIGSLAKAVGRTVVALTQMEKRGALPRTPLVASSLEYRLYSVEMIEAVQGAFHRRGGVIRGTQEWEAFYDEIEDDWARQGFMDARILE